MIIIIIIHSLSYCCSTTSRNTRVCATWKWKKRKSECIYSMWRWLKVMVPICLTLIESQFLQSFYTMWSGICCWQIPFVFSYVYEAYSAHSNLFFIARPCAVCYTHTLQFSILGTWRRYHVMILLMELYIYILCVVYMCVYSRFPQYIRAYMVLPLY